MMDSSEFFLLLLTIGFMVIAFVLGHTVGGAVCENGMEERLINYGKTNNIIEYNSKTGDLQFTKETNVDYKDLFRELKVELKEKE